MWLIRVIRTLGFFEKNVITLGKSSVKLTKKSSRMSTKWKSWKVHVTTRIKKMFVYHVKKPKVQDYYIQSKKISKVWCWVYEFLL